MNQNNYELTADSEYELWALNSDGEPDCVVHVFKHRPFADDIKKVCNSQYHAKTDNVAVCHVEDDKWAVGDFWKFYYSTLKDAQKMREHDDLWAWVESARINLFNALSDLDEVEKKNDWRSQEWKNAVASMSSETRLAYDNIWNKLLIIEQKIMGNK